MKTSELKIYMVGVALIFFLPLVIVYFITGNTMFAFMGSMALASGLVVRTTSRGAKAGNRKGKADNSLMQPRDLPFLIKSLLKLVLTANKDLDNIIGDLLEESSQFASKTKAYLWLYKQVLKSVVPLIYKNLKSRLAAYFGKRIR